MRWFRCLAAVVSVSAGCHGASEPKAGVVTPSNDAAIAPAVTTSGDSASSMGTLSTTNTSAESAPPLAKKAPRLVLHLVPLGDTSAETMSKTADALSTHAPLEVVVETTVALPKSAESSEKGRFRAEKLLDLLDGLPIDADGKHGKIMGVAELDIVTEKNGTKNWGILGLGAIDGRVSVISTYRMKRAFEKGGGAPEPLVRERLWKVSLHELGHTLGLEHCPVKGCIMEDGHGTVKTIDGETALCDACAARFAAALPKD